MPRKISALVLALIMVLSLCATALATDTLPAGKYDHTHENALQHANNTVRILKELVIYNTDGMKIYLPTVSYSYSIALDTDLPADTTVYDGTTTAYVHNEDEGSQALTTESATVSFSPATTYTSVYTAEGVQEEDTWVQPLTANSTGTPVYGAIDITFNPANFDHAGVYRYKITETPSGRDTAGITLGTDQPAGTTDATKDVRYLDVYVRGLDNDTDGTYDNYEIYGYVCFGPNDASLTTVDNTNGKKTNGFVQGSDGVGSLVDQYKTYNLVVTKDITGNLAQTGHDFPFEITLNSTLAAQLAYGKTETAAANQTTASVSTSDYANNKVVLTASTDGTINAGLSDDEHVNLYGIPNEAAVTIKVKEENDTYDVYTASVAITGKSGDDLKLYTSNITQDSSTEISALQRNDEANIKNYTVAVGSLTSQNITYTNNMTEISPTGYVARFAPYAAMLVAGIILLVVMKRRTAKEDI